VTLVTVGESGRGRERKKGKGEKKERQMNAELEALGTHEEGGVWRRRVGEGGRMLLRVRSSRPDRSDSPCTQEGWQQKRKNKNKKKRKCSAALVSQKIRWEAEGESKKKRCKKNGLSNERGGVGWGCEGKGV